MDMKKYISDVDDEKLKMILEISNEYNEGKLGLREARQKLKNKVGTIKAHEIALVEQELKEIEDDECQKEEIQKMLELFEEIMDKNRPELPEDHPIMCYYRENDALRDILLEIEDLVQYPVIKNQWLDIYDRLADFRIHLSRKQNQLYSVLEQKGFDRPTTTMWTLDNFIRDEISEARELIENGKDDEFIEMQETIVADLRDLMVKEESVLYPTSLSMINDKEFEDMKEGDKEIGFAWIEVSSDEKETEEEKKTDSKSEETLIADLAEVFKKHGYDVDPGKELDVATGKLTLEQINLIYKHMPVDLSFVDENEKVRFYSDTDHRIFPRSKNVIGRNVANCHPRASVHIVEEIVEKFKSGEEDHAEFWINKPDLFIYIYYTAVRDEEGNFKGVLEMMQECSRIRSLEGSQTLLTWGSEEGISDEKEPETEKTEIQEEAEGTGEDIEITPETKLADILKAYPWLKDEMEDISPKFKMLKTPLARVMIPKATVTIMSERGDISVEKLIEGIKEKIKNRK